MIALSSLETLVRRPFAVLSLLVCMLAIAPTAVSAPAPRPASEAPAVTAQRAKVHKLEKAKLTPAYPEALIELAKRYHAAAQLERAQATALEAAGAFDVQVELHKGLSEVVTTYELARAERTAARKLAMQRDEAVFLAAEWARSRGDTDAAVRHYAAVVLSQPDQPLGEQALAALTALGFVVPPPPASPAPSPSPQP